jgi:predicted NBD/HSP70 family sugar kinase
VRAAPQRPTTLAGAIPRSSTPWASPGHLFELVRSGQATRRRELQDVTGLSRSTVTGRVDQLLVSGLLHESGVDQGARGRPSTVLAVSDDYGVVLAADLGAAHARAAICDLASRTLVETSTNLLISDGPDVVLGWLERTWTEQLGSEPISGARVVGLGVGIPGPVDFDTGCAIRPPIMPGWDGYPVRTRLADRFGVPGFVENDANVMALGEYDASFPRSPSFLFVKVATGIGAGLVVDGRLIRGATGGSGDIGHIRLDGSHSEPQCACGAHGCLAATASGGAIARQLRELGRPAWSSRDAVQLAEQGDIQAVALIRNAGLLIGDVLATSVSLLNPQVLMIGGDLQRAQDHFMTALRERLYQRTQPLATRELLVLTSVLGERSGISGAARLVVDEVFSAESVDQMLAW